MSHLHEEANENHEYTATIISHETEIRTEYNIFSAIYRNIEPFSSHL
jgi:hypothetical protein